MKNQPYKVMLITSNLAKRESRMTLTDLLVLAAAGSAILNTNKELKGKNRRALRLAVNRAMRHAESL